MNKPRPPLGEQLLRSLMLSFAAMWMISYFFGWPGQPKKPEGQATRDTKLETRATLANAFAGLNVAPAATTPSDSPTPQVTPAPNSTAAPLALLTAAQAKTEAADLQKQIEANPNDKYAYWARLRVGLLQQYLLKDWAGADKHYDEIIKHASPDEVDAQAIFQKGNWQWFNASDAPEKAENATASTYGAEKLPTRQDAVWTLETLIHRGRAASGYQDTPIFVPVVGSGQRGALDAAQATRQLPTQGFQTATIGSLKGTLQNPNPQGVLDRINQFYSATTLNRGFDMLVTALGSNPNYSYGLAIIMLAVLLRILMQPINRKQYDSMRGLQKIGPEMKKIQEKYKDKPSDSPEVKREKQMKSFAEVRAIQKEHGVNPQMGCALMFIQLPIFFYLINPLMMHYEPKMNLVGANFAWISNLARPDYFLLALYGLSMLVSFRLSATPPTDDMQKQMQLMSTFVFPVMMPFFMKGFSSAFILYWMSFNVTSTFFQYRMMKSSDPDKNVIKALMGRNLLTPVEAMESAPANTSTVPPRPKSGAKTKNERAIKTLMAENESPLESDEESLHSAPVVKKVDASQIIGSNGVPHTNGSNGSNSDANGKNSAKPDGKSGNSAQRARRRRRY